MTMHYRRLVNDNADEIPWEGKLFSVLRLYDQNPNYVWKEALRYCSKNGELSDLNVIRRATWQMSPADDYQVGYMQDEETLLLADGYEFVRIDDLIYKENYEIRSDGTQIKK